MEEPAYRTIFVASPDPMWIFDESTLRFLDVNTAAARTYGYTREEFLAMTLRDIRHQEDVAALLSSMHPSGESGETLWTHLKKSGEEMQVTVFSTPTTFLGQPARAVTIRDVTPQVQARQELSSANMALRAILAASPASILSVDTQGRIETCNPAAEKLFGVKLSAARGGHAWTVFGFDEAAFAATLSRLIEGKDVEGIEMTIARGGDERHLLLSAAPLFDVDGAVRGAMAVILDNSESVRARHDLQAWSELLERRVSERTSELVAANDELEGFCASVSHDLRSPLRAIDGFSRAILEDYREALDEQGLDFLQRVRVAAWRMSALIDDLLGLTRLTRATLSRAAVDLSHLARDAVSELRYASDFREFEFACPDSVVVYGDQRLLKMLLSALLDNAWKFTGGEPSPQAEFRVESVDEDTIYVIQDNGVGFDMAYVGKLFRPFERLHRAVEFPGNGIGLATAQRIVAKHGGRIWAESKPGQGTTIRFTLGSPDERRI
jgi:PAS domain S-box-containing protein